jgi:hypothetical protein
MAVYLQRIIAKFGRSESIASHTTYSRISFALIAMQLLETIDYGPNTFGAYEKSGGNSENIDENFR